MADKPLEKVVTDLTALTPELIREDAVNRIGRTLGQTGAAASGLTLVLWIVGQAGWKGEMPATVREACVVLIATGVSAWMNRHRLKAG